MALQCSKTLDYANQIIANVWMFSERDLTAICDAIAIRSWSN